MSTNPNFEFYRKQAKSLLKAALAGETDALRRINSPDLALHTAQLAIAREQGFASWPRFRAFLMKSAGNAKADAGVFVELALSDKKRAEEMLSAHPGISRATLYTALVAGDPEGVNQFDLDVHANGGPRNWVPLLYVCFSRLSGAIPETARMLLKRGADPNAFYRDERWPECPLSCLYAAVGLNNNPELARVLLEGGANPNDSESLYHSTEHQDLRCMNLLLEHGASPNGTNALNHILEREDLAGLDLLLGAGADPNEAKSLHWAVWRGRSVRVVARLLDAGAEIDAVRSDGRTAYALALLAGRPKIARLLLERGANPELLTIDRFIANPEAFVETPEIHQAEQARLVSDLASIHRTAAVRALLAAGLPVDARGDLGGTALHWACWKGYPDLVKLLLDHGASLTTEDTTFQGTPAGWFTHGLRNCADAGGGYPEVANLLIEAGAKFQPGDVPTGHESVDRVLRERGVIG